MCCFPVFPECFGGSGVGSFLFFSAACWIWWPCCYEVAGACLLSLECILTFSLPGGASVLSVGSLGHLVCHHIARLFGWLSWGMSKVVPIVCVFDIRPRGRNVEVLCMCQGIVGGGYQDRTNHKVGVRRPVGWHALKLEHLGSGAVEGQGSDWYICVPVPEGAQWAVSSLWALGCGWSTIGPIRESCQLDRD